MALTSTQLVALIEGTMPDNGTGVITPAAMRNVLEAMVGSLASSGTPLAAILLAVEAVQPGGAATLQQSLPPDPSDPVNICWNHHSRVVAPDPLRPTTTGYVWRFIAAVTGLDMPTLAFNASQITGY